MTFLLRTHQVLVSLGLFHPLALFDQENLNICHAPAPLSFTPYGTTNSFTGTPQTDKWATGKPMESWL